jgi:hypothetical protein
MLKQSERKNFSWKRNGGLIKASGISEQNADQNRDIEIAERSFENMSQLKYLGTTETNQNLIQEECGRRLNSGDDCYHSVFSSTVQKFKE